MTKDTRIFIRIPADEKAAIQAALDAKGTTLSKAVREYLQSLVQGGK